jgi:hypothetical protein
MTEPENKNLISFIEAVKKKYYSHSYREYSKKRQLHLIDVVSHDDKLKKKSLLEVENGPDIA